MKQIVEINNRQALRSTRRNATGGFTLVELLVVIAIIAVLAGLLMPALRAARQEVQVIQCESNMRQVGAALFGYLSDSRGKLPAGSYYDCISGSSGQQYEFPVIPTLVYGNYLPQGPLVYNIFYTSNTAWSAYVPPVLQCPAAGDPLNITRMGSTNNYTTAKWQNLASGQVCNVSGAETWQGSAPIHGYSYGIYTHYAFNDLVYVRWHVYTINGYLFRAPFATMVLGPTSAYTGPTPNAVDGTQYNITAVRHAEQTWMAWECCDADVPFMNPVFRHRNLSNNFLYFDGHVENLRTSDIQTNVSYIGCLWDNRLIFDRE